MMDDSVHKSRLYAEDVTIGYDRRVISTGLSVAIPDGAFTVIVGANACGKSTLLRALARLLKPSAGRVVLDGKSIADYPAREVARRLGLLPQSSIAPDGITVADLVARGRYPHQSFLQQWSDADESAVIEAMAATHITELSHRAVDELSGGQRQRVWIAMVLAQQTPILLLDEPTAALDLRHQEEVMRAVRLRAAAGHAVLVVVHDLTLAAAYADRIAVVSGGTVVAAGTPGEVLTASRLEAVYGLPVDVTVVNGRPVVLPRRVEQ